MLTVIFHTASLLTACRLPCYYNLFPKCMLSHFCHVWVFASPWSRAFQVPLSMGFSRQEYWSALPCPLPGDLPNPGIESTHLITSALEDRFSTTSTTWEAQVCICKYVIFNLFKLSPTSHVPPWSLLIDLIALCSKSAPFLDDYKIDTYKYPVLFNMHDVWVEEKGIQLFPPAHMGLGRIFTTGTYKYFMCRLLCGNIILWSI